MAFKDRLVEARKRKGLTQEELSKIINSGVSTIKKWEKGTSSPNGEWQAKLMNALEVDANFLYQDIINLAQENTAGIDTLHSLSDDDWDLMVKKQDDETRLIENYRKLNKEYQEFTQDMIERLVEITNPQPANQVPEHIPFLAQPVYSTLNIPFYPDRPSAGTGMMMFDNESPFNVQVKETPESKKADFVLQVSGSSMEPKYSNDDLVLVKKQDVVDNGEIGIFLYDGNVFIKQLKDDLLHSLNPEYDDILIDGEIICFGKVLGKAEI